MKIAIKREQNPNLFEILSSVSNLRDEGAKKNDVERPPQLRALFKYILMMKIVMILSLASVCQVMADNSSAYAQQTKLDIKLKDASLEEAIWSIQKQTEFDFFYNLEDIQEITGISVDLQDATTEEILSKILKGTDLTYEILYKTVILKKIENKPAEPVRERKEQVEAQKKTIRGTVKTEQQESIPGAAIIVSGTTIGTITDADGNFRLEIPEDAKILVFSFVGMESREVPIGNQTTFNIILTEKVTGIGEVVIVGYGEQRKESVVGAISQATGDQLQKMHVPEVANSLTGLIPGLVTIRTSGLPGQFAPPTSGSNDDRKTEIYLRGQTTWNGGQPLILVDGVERSIDDVETNEIEGISVLKDASATSVFGVRGANGVILVTTKRGQATKPKLSFDGQYTFSFFSKIASTLNSYDANEFRNNVIVNELGVNPSSWDRFVPKRYLDYYKTQEYPELFPDVNWRELMVKDFASAYKFNANLSGGTRFMRYFGSLSYTHEGGILDGKDLGTGHEPNMNFDRLNFRSNLDFQFTSSTKVTLNLAGSYGRQSDVGAYNNNWKIWSGVYQRPPDLFPLQYADGTYADYTSDYPSPYVALNFGGIDYYTRFQYTTDIKITQKLDFITKGLSAGGSFSYDNAYGQIGPRIGGSNIQTKWVDPRAVDADPSEYENFVIYNTIATNSGYNWVQTPSLYSGDEFRTDKASRQLFYEFRLDYARTFGKHDVTALALVNRTEGATGSGFISKREDWVGRITYSYDNRYFLEFNGGYNGSEKFDRKYRFGFFPSAAVGWMISSEEFFRNMFPWWTTLKPRYSIGLVGSDAGINRWLYVSSWNVYSGKDRIFGYPSGQSSGYPLSEEGAIANPDVRWETARKQNLGLETGFFNNKLKANIELFKDYRYDMLIASSDRANYDLFGASLPPANLGKAETKGYEVELMFDQRFQKELSLSLKLTHGYAKDEILFKDDPPLRPDYQKLAGYQINQSHSFINAGVIQSWNELYTTVLDASNSNRLPGDYKIIDFNADGVIDSKDVIPAGYPSRPQHNYSFTLATAYKGFTLSAMFYGVYNVTINESYFRLFPNNYNVVYPWHQQDSWIPEYNQTTSATMNAARYLSTWQTAGTANYNLIDGSYLKLKNVELAYSLSSKALKKLRVSNMRFYVTGYDLFFWSGKLREDREGASEQEGQSYTSYPLMKRVTFGLSVGL